MAEIRVLLIDDDAVDREVFRRHVASESLPYSCALAGSVAEAKKIFESELFDAVISDYMLGDGTAFDILDLKLETPVVVVTGAGSEEVAVKAIKAGAYDYLIKDHENNYLKVLSVTIEKAIRQKNVEERVRLVSDRESHEAVIAGGSGISGTMRLIELAASSTSPALITGETGTGKTLAARAIHYRSPARKFPFISINCASLPESLIESELFGYEKGAFTGAVSAKRGIFETAEGGTLFLDEIGEMPLHLQAKLLSAIEDKTIRRLGSESMRPVNVRIIAATGVNLEEAVGKTFRKDLFYRLSVIHIHVPPLRERKEDIPELCRHFRNKIGGSREIGLAEGEPERLASYHWPGNVRELYNILERALILQGGPELRPSDLIFKSPSLSRGDCDPGRIMPLDEVEKSHIGRALESLSGNLAKTAKALGISLSTLKRKIKGYRLK